MIQDRRKLAAPAMLLLITVAGAALRIHLLGWRDLWVDEALSVLLGWMPWRQFWTSLWGFQANMGLYYLLLRGWLAFGDSEAAVRSFSVACGVLAIPMTYLLGKRLFGTMAALAGCALMAVNAFAVRYSQEARSYALVMLLAVLSTFILVRLLDAPKRRLCWAAYVVTCVAGVYAHFFFCLVIASHGLALLPSLWRRLPPKSLLQSICLFALLTAPAAYFILFRDQGQLSWVPSPTVAALSQFAAFFTGDGRWPLALAYASACAVALLPTGDRPATMPIAGPSWAARLIAIWLLCPFLSLLAISIVKPVFSERFMCFSAPALCLLAGHGLGRLDKARSRLRPLGAIGLLGMLALSVWGVHRYNMSKPARGDQWHAAVEFLQSRLSDKDALVFYRASAAWPYRYYSRRRSELGGPISDPDVLFPSELADPQQEPSYDRIRAALSGHRRAWLVVQHADLSAERQATLTGLQSLLETSFHLSLEESFAGVTGRIYVMMFDANKLADRTVAPGLDPADSGPTPRDSTRASHAFPDAPRAPLSGRAACAATAPGAGDIGQLGMPAADTRPESLCPVRGAGAASRPAAPRPS